MNAAPGSDVSNMLSIYWILMCDNLGFLGFSVELLVGVFEEGFAKTLHWQTRWVWVLESSSHSGVFSLYVVCTRCGRSFQAQTPQDGNIT